jgi:serine/threonine-protein kinase RsbW
VESSKRDEDPDSPELQEQRRFFPADYSSLEEIRSFVGQAAETCQIDPDNVYRVQVAVDEAFSNIVEHAYAGEPEENVECACRLTPSGLTVILTHHGRPFDPDQVKGPPLNVSLKERKRGGLGLFFMRKWMDDVRFEVIPEAGSKHPRNVLTMLKRTGA